MRRIYFFIVLVAAVVLTPLAVVLSAPNAAWVKHPSNPIFGPSANGWDNSNVMAAKIVYEGGYRMWYTGNGTLDQRTNIGYATSADGISWTRYGTQPVMRYSSQLSWEAHGVSAPSIYHDVGAGLWKMWYAGKDWSGDYNIGYATSPDGLTWNKYAGNPVLTPSDTGGDDASVVSPNVIYRAGVYHMWYAGRGNSNQIFYAMSPDGISWTKHGEPVVTLGGDFTWDNGEIAAPAVLYTNSRFDMWYQGYSRGTLQRYLGHAWSTDGITWTKDPLNPVVGLEPNKWDSYSIYYPSVYVSPLGDPMLWYQGESGVGNTKSLGVVLWDPNAIPTPLPTFANEPPTPTDEPPPTETPTPIPVRCAFEGVECVLLPEISNGNK